MRLIDDHRSVNWNDRPLDARIDTVVLHYTGMQSGKEALTRLCDPEAEVSAHYMIEENGSVYRLVEEERRAWHAGVSCWQGRENLNHSSIGIELVNPGHEFGYKPFPDAQIDSLLKILDGIKTRHEIPTSRFIGHSDIAPSRKTDPGELFPWQQLAAEGFGVFSDKDASDQTLVIEKGMQGTAAIKLNKQLGIVGYHGCDYDTIGDNTERVIKAFQAHWRPTVVTGIYDAGTSLVLSDITKMILVGDPE